MVLIHVYLYFLVLLFITHPESLLTHILKKDLNVKRNYTLSMKLKILGSGQDAGIPHAGCNCEICKKAKIDSKFRRYGPSIAIYDENMNFCYIIDASPDFKYQLNKSPKTNGIFRIGSSNKMIKIDHFRYFSKFSEMNCWK